MIQLETFIQGENIRLCMPTEEFALKSDWYSWLNCPENTRYMMGRGIMPNTPEDQLNFYRSEKGKRLMLIIEYKGTCMGTVSLSKINPATKTAEMAILLNKAQFIESLPYIGLEAAALISTHGMETIGLNRIYSGQHIHLKGWSQRKELLGYRVEGIVRENFVRGHEVANAIVSSLIFKDYLRLKQTRGGRYWDSLEKMQDRIKKLPREKFVDKLEVFLRDNGDSYYNGVFEL